MLTTKPRPRTIFVSHAYGEDHASRIHDTSNNAATLTHLSCYAEHRRAPTLSEYEGDRA
jgi:hypothetical protein